MGAAPAADSAETFLDDHVTGVGERQQVRPRLRVGHPFGLLAHLGHHLARIDRHRPIGVRSEEHLGAGHPLRDIAGAPVHQSRMPLDRSARSARSAKRMVRRSLLGIFLGETAVVVRCASLVAGWKRAQHAPPTGALAHA